MSDEILLSPSGYTVEEFEAIVLELEQENLTRIASQETTKMVQTIIKKFEETPKK